MVGCRREGRMRVKEWVDSSLNTLTLRQGQVPITDGSFCPETLPGTVLQ